MQADGFEADIERLNSGKKKKSNDAKIAQFENGIAAHKYHIGRLEQVRFTCATVSPLRCSHNRVCSVCRS